MSNDDFYNMFSCDQSTLSTPILLVQYQLMYIADALGLRNKNLPHNLSAFLGTQRLITSPKSSITDLRNHLDRLDDVIPCHDDAIAL